MTNWEEYKEHIRATDPRAAKIINETEMLSPVIGEMIVRRQELCLNQRDLAEKCGVPHSTIARMESGAVTPKLDTLIKVCRELGLRLKVERVKGAKE